MHGVFSEGDREGMGLGKTGGTGGGGREWREER